MSDQNNNSWKAPPLHPVAAQLLEPEVAQFGFYTEECAQAFSDWLVWQELETGEQIEASAENVARLVEFLRINYDRS